MSDVTALEIIDSAVKIGLGALIASVSAYYLAMSQHSRELQKEKIRREFDLLKQISEQVEQFTHTALKYWALIGEWARSERIGATLPEARTSLLLSVTDELFASFKEMTYAEATLSLLGYKKAQALARAYGEIVRDFRSTANRLVGPLTEEQSQEWRGRILHARENLFDELGVCYRNLGL